MVSLSTTVLSGYVASEPQPLRAHLPGTADVPRGLQLFHEDVGAGGYHWGKDEKRTFDSGYRWGKDEKRTFNSGYCWCTDEKGHSTALASSGTFLYSHASL